MDNGRGANWGRLSSLRHSLVVFAAALSLGACQSSSPSDVLAVDSAGQAAAPATVPAAQASGAVIGSGAVRLAIISDTASGASPTEIRNAAELAIKGLDNGSLSVEILPVSGGDNALSEKAVEAFVRGASAIAYAGSAPSSGAGNSVLELALVPNGSRRPGKSLAFMSSISDSLEAAIEFAPSAGEKTVLLLVPAGQAPARLDGAINRLKANARIQRVDYVPGEAPSTLAARLAIPAGSIVAFAGSGPEIANLAAALRAKAGQQASVTFVGNSGWQSAGLVSSPALDGALVALPDRSGEKLVADKYRAAYGQVPSASALYVYDAVAILAGINRAKGQGGLKDGTIMSKAGFRGATGAFRFRLDGTVERLFTLNKVAGGKLVTILPVATGF